jgi:hypothetical protein
MNLNKVAHLFRRDCHGRGETMPALPAEVSLALPRS